MLTTRARGIISVKDRLVARALIHDEIPNAWEEIQPYLERSVEASMGMSSVDQLYKQLCEARASAIVVMRDGVVETVLVVTITQYPTYRAACVTACGGKNLTDAAREHFDILESWALLNECSEIEAWVAPGMARLLRRVGFKHKKAIVSYSLRSRLQ